MRKLARKATETFTAATALYREIAGSALSLVTAPRRVRVPQR